MAKKLTVSQLNRYIKGVFEDELILHGISVEGEIFEFKVAGNNSYIILSEGDCFLHCVYFSSVVDYQVGTRVCVNGSVEFYPKGGRLSFVIKNLRLCGEGELALKKKLIIKKLQEEGVFENNRGLKPFVKSIALITSGEGAVMHDFCSVINRLAPYVDIKIFNVKVQGVGAASEIAHTMSDIISKKSANLLSKNDFDVVVIARGGGSAIDLEEFNNQELARAVYKSPITVLSAVGHETDYTVCDLAADIRAGTPSIAAEMIANNNRAFVKRIYDLSCSISASVTVLLNRKSRLLVRQNEKSTSNTLNNINSVRHKIVKINNRHKNLVDGLADCRKKSLLSAVKKNFDLLLFGLNEGEMKLKVLCAEADKLSPLKILGKGYARVVKGDRLISGVGDLKTGDGIRIVMADGDAVAEIKSTKKR